MVDPVTLNVTFDDVDTNDDNILSAEEIQASMKAQGLDLTEDQAEFVAALLAPANDEMAVMEPSHFTGIYSMIYALLREAAAADKELDIVFRKIDIAMIAAAFDKALEAADKTKQGALANLIMTIVGAALAIAVGVAGYRATNKIGGKPPVEPPPLPPKPPANPPKANNPKEQAAADAAHAAKVKEYDEAVAAHAKYAKDMEAYKVAQTQQQLYAQLWAQVGGPLAGMLGGSGQAIEQIFSSMAQVLQAESEKYKSQGELAASDSAAYRENVASILKLLIDLINAAGDAYNKMVRV